MRIGDAGPPARTGHGSAAPVPCPACAARDAAPFHRERGWRYVRCRRCRTVYLDPRPAPDAVRAHYDDYLPSGEEAIAAWEASQRPLIRRAVRLLVRSLAPGDRVLDVGCGYGFLAHALHRAGFAAEGIEISATGADHAARLGVPVTRATLREAAFPDGAFAALTAFYVIEHLPDPAAFLAEARRVIAPGGWILLRWPHSAPLVRWCRLLGRPPDLFDAPSHLVDFTPESLGALLRRCGFAEVKTWPGGSTRSPERLALVAGILGAVVGDALYALSAGRFVAPGASKTTLARAR